MGGEKLIVRKNVCFWESEWWRFRNEGWGIGKMTDWRLVERSITAVNIIFEKVRKHLRNH